MTPAKGKSKADGAGLRRTASDAQAETSRPSGSDRLQEDIATATSPGALPAEFHHPHLQTMKTKGFSGSVQTPDPQLAMQTHLNDGMPHWNDPTHIMPAHQLRHQQSSRTLAALAKANDDEPGGARGEAKTNGPSAPQGTRSSAGSGLPITHESPSFPFPTVNVLYSASSPLASTDPTTLRDRISSADGISKPRRRLASGTEPPRIPHRRSISSLRSAHFLRAPPHPLNSSTGYRSEMLPTVGTSRPGSAFTAPEKKDRVPSMHHPPLAPPIVYRENASGQGWDDPERQESSGRVQINSHDMGQRKSSSSSARSLNGILTGPIYNRPQVSPAASSASSHASNAPRPRRSALEAAASMSKLPTTHDPALYYQSLGLPSTSAETAHLISRFLPQKKIVRPSWEISPAEAREGHVGIGLTNGDYREAHESLVRSMRDLSLGTTASRRSASKSYSYRNLLGSGSSSATDVVAQGGVGMISGINGPKMVSRGAWRGRTPFELSVERCLAQRPKGPVSGLQA